MKKKLTTWESTCIITGYGIGGGVMAIPYLMERNGLVVSLVILALAFAASFALHWMIAKVALAEGGKLQIIGLLSKYLFRGKLKNALSISFFVLMGLVMITNLAAYISGAAEVLTAWLPLPMIVAELLFYLVAAVVVFFGLKIVGVCEKVAMIVIFATVGVLAAASLFAPANVLPMLPGTVTDALAYFGMAMFALSAFFSVPQAVAGLECDEKKIKTAVFWGLMNNVILIVIIGVCALLASTDVTEVAMIGWSEGIGAWAEMVGGVFTVLAMLTTYWSISLALKDIVSDQLKLNDKVCWLIATVPSLILALAGLSGFMGFMRIAGGVIGVIVAIMIVPTYYRAQKEIISANKAKYLTLCAAVMLAYVLMAVGSVVTV